MTKILAFSDVHRDMAACERIIALSENVDLVIGAGDFATARRGLKEVMDCLSRIKKPFAVVPGNSESLEELKAACEGFPNIHVLHGSGVILKGIPIFGIGGGIPVTPFGAWSYDFTEEEAVQLLKDCPFSGILISHSPPFGAVDVTNSGTSIGSTSIRNAILAKTPRFCICGHVHACAGKKASIGDTIVLNAGPHGVFLTI